MSLSERSFGCCGAVACRAQKASDDQHRRADAHRNEILEKAKQVTSADAATRGVTLSDAHEPAIVPFVGVGTRLAPVPEGRRSDFLDRLRERIAENFSDYPETPQDRPVEDFGECLNREQSELIRRACTTCEGCCCRLGYQNTSYIKPSTILRYRFEHPTASPEAILADYAAQIAAEAYEDSCVYHGSAGCTLPKEMRSDMCDEYLCYGIKDMLIQFETRPQTMGYVVATDEQEILKMMPLFD